MFWSSRQTATGFDYQLVLNNFYAVLIFVAKLDVYQYNTAILHFKRRAVGFLSEIIWRVLFVINTL